MVATTQSGIAGRIVRQLRALAGEGTELVRTEQRDWASATFSGARHLIDLVVPAAALARVLAALPDHDFGLGGEIVADCTASATGASQPGGVPVRVELLTIVADRMRFRCELPLNFRFAVSGRRNAGDAPERGGRHGVGRRGHAGLRP